VKLPILDLKIAVDESNLSKLAKGTGDFNMLHKLRQMKVSKAFNLVLVILVDATEAFSGLDDEFEENSQEFVYCVDVSRKYVPDILRLLTPNTLRDENFEDKVCCGIQYCAGEEAPGYAARTLKEWEAESPK
jgi:hypothetical protein